MSLSILAKSEHRSTPPSSRANNFAMKLQSSLFHNEIEIPFIVGSKFHVIRRRNIDRVTRRRTFSPPLPSPPLFAYEIRLPCRLDFTNDFPLRADSCEFRRVRGNDSEFGYRCCQLNVRGLAAYGIECTRSKFHALYLA